MNTPSTLPPVDPASSGDPFVRVRFHAGMLVGAEELIVEQRAGLLRHRLHQALLHRHGRIFGLQVSAADAAGAPISQGSGPCLRVEAGLALDALGREIFIPRRQLLDVSALHTNMGFWSAVVGGRVWVSLRHEVTPSMRTAGARGLEVAPFGRLQDGFALELVATRPQPIDPLALMAEDPGALWAGDPPAPLALAAVTLIASGGGLAVGAVTLLGPPRLLHCNIKQGSMFARLDAPVRGETVTTATVQLRALPAGMGWLDVPSAVHVSADRLTIRVTPATAPVPGTLCRLLLVGTGETPIFGSDEQPLSGSAEDPGGPSGRDAIAVGRWPGEGE